MLKQNFLLCSELAEKLYRECARELPIIDYHNHLSLADISENRRFLNIYDLWIAPDPYKHRAMRMCGVPEKYITGDAEKSEKFAAWCSVFPRLIGNPLYHWSAMELETLFGISYLPEKSNAAELYKSANSHLEGNDISAKSLLSKFNVEFACPCASLTDSFDMFENNSMLSPSLRGDDAVSPDMNFIRNLEKLSGVVIRNLDSYKLAVKARLDIMKNAGCRFSDHALDNGFEYFSDDGNNAHRFDKILLGAKISEADEKKLFSHLLLFLCEEYARRDFTVQLHIGAKRFTSSALRKKAGAAGGFAGIGNSVDIVSLTRFLDELEQTPAGLPKIVLFTLNPADNAIISVLSGSYAKDGVPGLITQGPAWWWCDHKYGICDMLENAAAFGTLSNFVGMTTDSRSFLSFVRHDYFRRILCDWVAAKANSGEYFASHKQLEELIRNMCYTNAKNIISGKGENKYEF